MSKPKVYKAYDFYTHEHSKNERDAVAWLERHGYSWKAYGQPSRTVFVASKDGIEDEFIVERYGVQFNDMVSRFCVCRTIHTTYMNMKKAVNRNET